MLPTATELYIPLRDRYASMTAPPLLSGPDPADHMSDSDDEGDDVGRAAVKPVVPDAAAVAAAFARPVVRRSLVPVFQGPA